ASAQAKFFCVGDDDQSIYTFRGANVGNMADFERDFKVAKVVRLEQNYRSHGNILDAANALISNNRNRLGKNLWTAAGKGEPLRVFEGESDMDEARWLAEEVRALAREGTRLVHVAVLYRSNAQSRVLEHALFSQAIPYRVENLEELVNAAAAFTKEERETEPGETVDPLTAFLTHAALEAGEHQAGEGQDALQLMTVHSAKGLEFDAVFLTGLEEGLFPH